MKRILFLMFGVVFGFVGILMAGPSEDAQALKKDGDYVQAAKLHPHDLCKAQYLFDAACKITGKRDKRGRWVQDLTKYTEANKTLALGYLNEADGYIESSNGQEGTENEGCAGVDAEMLKLYISNVRACIEGHCN